MRYHPVLAVTLALAAAAQSSPGIMRPLVVGNGARFGPAVISTTDVAGEVVQDVLGVELQSVGNTFYRVVATVQTTTAADTKMIVGLLDAGPAPAWVPWPDLAALNVGGATWDEGRCSMSGDDLVLVWDNLVGAGYPNSGAVANTFVCARLTTAVPFDVNNVRAIRALPAGGVDPHIGEQLQNGNVVVYHLDANGDIAKAEVDPSTGAVLATSLAVARGGNAANQTPGTVVLCHSPAVQRDSLGRARALTYCELIGSDSHCLWLSGVDNTGNKYCIARRELTARTVHVFGGTAVVGGTWVLGQWVGAPLPCRACPPLVPSVLAGSALADADLRRSDRIVAFAPMQSTMLSIVAIGAAAPPYPIVPVRGDLLVTPSVGVLDARPHHPWTGGAEWVFPAVPVLGATFAMQVVTLDVASGSVHAGNAATLRL